MIEYAGREIVYLPYFLRDLYLVVRGLTDKEIDELAKGPIPEQEGKCRVCNSLGFPENITADTPLSNVILSAYHNCADIPVGEEKNMSKVMQARCFTIYLIAEKIQLENKLKYAFEV